MEVAIKASDGHDDNTACPGEYVQYREHDKEGELVATEAGAALEGELTQQSVILFLH